MSSTPSPVLEIARRAELRSEGGYAWFVLIPSGQPGENSTADLRDELEVALNSTVRVVTAGTAPVHNLVTTITERADDVVLLCDLDGWGEDEWAAFDIQRSALERRGAMMLVLSAISLLRLSNTAPNIRSYIGGSIFQLASAGGILTNPERDSRIRDLERYYGLLSQEVVEKAEQGSLTLDPNFVEWLVLLGRGDLV